MTAALLVFVEVMKELPATALLRPLGGDTLAVAVWEATKDSRFDTAALPALLIVAVGLVPVVLAIRLSRAGAGALRRSPRRGPQPLDQRGVLGLVQQEAGRVEDVAVAQALQARGALGLGIPGGDRGGVRQRLEPVGLRLVERLAQPREVVGDPARARGVRLRASRGPRRRRRSGTPGGRVRATPRAASQSG